jgi:hypothetical protein
MRTKANGYVCADSVTQKHFAVALNTALQEFATCEFGEIFRRKTLVLSYYF